MSEPTSPDPAAGVPERLHPLFLVTGLGGSLRGLAGGYAVLGYLAISGRLVTAIFGAVALLTVMAVGIALYWARFEFRVGRGDIRIDSGIVSRRHRSIPFDRIQDVEITQGPIARLLGLAQVKFETGGGSVGPNAEEAVLHAIPLARAHEIRELVRATREALPIAAAEGGRPPVYAMDLRRLLLAGTFNFSLAVAAGLFGLTQTAGEVIGFDPLDRSFWSGLVERNSPLAEFTLEHRVGAAVAGILLLLVIGAATGVIRTFVREYGFRLDRTDAGLRRRRGLLTRSDVTLPVRRVQAIIVGTGPVRERFGWSDLKLQSLARDEGGKGDHQIAPLARDGEIDAVVAELGWRPIRRDLDWQRLPLAYVGALALALSPLVLLAIAQAAAFGYAARVMRGADAIEPLAILLAGLIVALIILAIVPSALTVRWLAWRRAAYALDGDRLLVRTGWWRRRLTVLPMAKIQSIDLSENFISRLFGTARLRFGVAGGGIGGHSIPAIPRLAARQLRDQLLGSAA